MKQKNEARRAVAAVTLKRERRPSEERNQRVAMGKGRLWRTGNGKVSIKIAIDGEKQTCIVDAHNQIMCASSGTLAKIPPESLVELLAEAQRTREDPRQLKKLAESVERRKAGAVKSLRALSERHTKMKIAHFKECAIEIMNRGFREKDLFVFIKEAVIESVHAT